ncbi:MAG: SDR family NAD(P)-dependent oxidoreductase [Variovorax sp.]|nr:MAG: SDR family NAD(P)-dependent oxidoreductase [Variovorax sp.]
MSRPVTLFRNVVLTGACGGLGQALARELIGGGARVALVGLDTAALDALRARAPERCAVYTPDVSNAAAMQAMAADWTARHGVPDLVIANAGVAGGYDTGEAEDLAVFRRMLEINLLGAATTFQPFLRAMQAERRGALVGVASLAGWRGLPGNGAYCASKAAGRTHIVLPRRIGWLSKALALLPSALHDHILRGQPRKPRVGEAGATPIPGLPTGTAPSVTAAPSTSATSQERPPQR